MNSCQPVQTAPPPSPFWSRMHVRNKYRMENLPKNNGHDEENYAQPEKNLYHFHRRRCGQVGQADQRLAAGGATDRPGTNLMRTRRAFDERKSGGAGSGHGNICQSLRQPEFVQAFLAPHFSARASDVRGIAFRASHGHFKKMLAGDAQFFPAGRHHVRRIAFGTVHGSLAKVSQLSRARPRDFSGGFVAAVPGELGRGATADISQTRSVWSRGQTQSVLKGRGRRINPGMSGIIRSGTNARGAGHQPPCGWLISKVASRLHSSRRSLQENIQHSTPNTRGISEWRRHSVLGVEC